MSRGWWTMSGVKRRFAYFCAALVLLGVGIGWSLALHLWWHVAVGIAIGALVWSEASRRMRNAR